MTTSPTLPRGWAVEMQGLSAAVVFTNGRWILSWCDGLWHIETSTGMVRRADALPYAANMKQARRIGTAFIADMYAEDEDA